MLEIMLVVLFFAAVFLVLENIVKALSENSDNFKDRIGRSYWPRPNARMLSKNNRNTSSLRH
ncbi:MAG: hypothetical protein ACPGYT_11760 [Nitrospirales bacterium]